jgi:copper transporter 1
MLFTWSTDNLCIVFRQWHITSTLSLVVSLIGIVAISAGYEAVREGIRRYEASVARRAETAPREHSFHLPFPSQAPLIIYPSACLAPVRSYIPWRGYSLKRKLSIPIVTSTYYC